jgi:hypothetical protein
MCTEQLPPGGYPIAVKYIYHIVKIATLFRRLDTALVVIFTFVVGKADYNSGCNICPKIFDTRDLDSIEICVRSDKECGHTLKKFFTLRNM